VGRDGGVNELRIRDSRDDGEVHPNEFTDKAVSFDFTDDITGSPNTWDAVITMKGWSDNYRAYQIWSSASSGSSSVDTVPLFFRSGEEDVQDGWGATKEILTFAGTAPRVDGAADQILQTDGAGTLSWVDLPAGGGGATPPSGAAGAIQFSDGAAFTSDDANLHYDNANNRLGIGTNSPSETLHVKGHLLLEDPSADGVDHLLEVKSYASSASDNARILISADTDTKLPILHLRDIEANSGVFGTYHSAFIALERASAILSGSAQNDLLITNAYGGKSIHFATGGTSDGDQPPIAMTIASDGDVGIGTTTPDNPLHVVGAGNFPLRIQADEGNLRMNKFGHLHIQNDNTLPTDGTTIDSPLWSVGQRDGGQFDIAFGALSTQLVSYNDRLLELKRDSNSATGEKQIGFLGATPTGAIDDGTGSALQPISPALAQPASPNETVLAQRLDEILAGLQALGLFA